VIETAETSTSATEESQDEKLADSNENPTTEES
jgi:hypothetical protein